MNLLSMYRYIGYTQEVFHSFALPGFAAVIMGAVAFFIYRAVYYIVHMNLIAIIFAVVVGVLTYGIVLILIGGMSEDELRSMPKGHLLVAFCRKIHIL